MIFVKGYGQMCNNILQYGHIYAWGKENNVRTISMRFSYKYQYFELCNSKYHQLPTYLFAKFLIKTRLIKHLWLEEMDDVTPEVIEKLQKSKMIALSGWGFRFKDIFLKHEDEIKRLFTVKNSIRKRVDQYLLSCKKADIRLAVHIRRGDYANFMGGAFFYDDETYMRNIREFIALFPDKKVAIFLSTNDKKLDIGSYKAHLNTDSIYLLGGNEGEDLYLLSQCDYIIGAKSTFSLIASFYRHLPIYHIMDKSTPLTLESFNYFEDLFMFA